MRNSRKLFGGQKNGESETDKWRKGRDEKKDEKLGCMFEKSYFCHRGKGMIRKAELVTVKLMRTPSELNLNDDLQL